MFGQIFSTPKYTLIATNVLLVITGIIILSVGISVQSAYNEYYDFLSSIFFSLPAFCIASGVIIFLFSAAGFYGAFMENITVHMVFAGFMVIIFIFQLSACIAGYVLQGNTLEAVQTQLNSTMEKYGVGNDATISQLWDEVQYDFKCCGVSNATDWLIPLNTTDTEGLPVTCCEFVYGTIETFTCTITNSYNVACAPVFGSYVKSIAASIGVAGIFLILMQAMVVAGAVWAIKISGQ